MKRDILLELAEGKISPKQAEEIYISFMDSDQGDVSGAFCLSKIEATAFLHGVGLPELAQWRKHGWPNKCILCGKALDVPKFGWMAKEIGPDRHALEHIECPIAASRET